MFSLMIIDRGQARKILLCFLFMRGKHRSKRLGSKVFRKRKKQGLSQEDLSALSDVDRTYIGKVENGKANPSFKILCKLARALRVTLEDLFKEV